MGERLATEITCVSTVPGVEAEESGDDTEETGSRNAKGRVRERKLEIEPAGHARGATGFWGTQGATVPKAESFNGGSFSRLV